VLTKSCLAALVISLLIVYPTFGQDKSDASGSQQPKDKQGAPSNLEDMLAKALKQNPDILVAEAKVRTAEAELNQVRQQVLAKIVMLNAEIDAANAILREAALRYARLTELRNLKPRSIVTDEELGTAKETMLKYKAELARKEAELPLLIGKRAAGLAGDQSKALATSPDGQWLLAEIDGRIVMKNLTTGKWVDPKALDLKKSTADKVRAALETQVKVNYKNVPVEEVLEHLQASVKGVNFHLAARGINNTVTAKLSEPVSLLDALQLLEDTIGVHFMVRDYGIVAVHILPPGAISVSDFARQSAEKTTK